MPTERYDVIFRGQIMDGGDLSVVRSQIGRLFNATTTQLDQLFSGHPVVLKRGVDLEIANRLRVAFRRAGGIVEVRSHDVVETPPATATELQALPPNTGSLEDCATQPIPQPIPDIQHLTMATPGTQIDRTPPPPPPAIDTSALRLIAGQTWSLEDCYVPPPPAIVPNTQNLTLANPGAIIDTSKPKPPARINTNAIELVADSNWDLRDCQPPPPPPLIVDLTALTIAESTATN